MVRAMKRGERGRAGRPPGSSGVVPSMRNGRSRKPQQGCPESFLSADLCLHALRQTLYIHYRHIRTSRPAPSVRSRLQVYARYARLAASARVSSSKIAPSTHTRRDADTRTRAPSTYARGCPRSTSFRIGPMKATLQIGRSMSSAALVCRSVSGQIHHQSHPSPSHHPDRRPLVNRCDPHTLIHRGQPRPTFRPPARRREHSRRGQ